MNTPAILIIHNYYRHTGGEDTVVMHEAEALKQAGADVHELYFHNPHTTNSITRLARFFAGIFFNISAYFKVYRLVKKKKINLVHVHNVFYQATPSVFWAARHAGARVVATVHNYRLFCLNALFYREGKQCTKCFDQRSFASGVRFGCFRNSKWHSLALAGSLNLHRALGTWTKTVDKFVVVNPVMEQYLLGLGIKNDRIYLKPNCIADNAYTGYGQRDDFFFFAGRLETEKGLPEVLHAWEQLPFPLQVAGAGSLHRVLESQQSPKLSFLGHLSQEIMQQKLAACRAVIFASKLKEGMPLSIIEAMAAGAICIAHATEVTSMLIQDGVTGILFHHGDDGLSLRKAVKRLASMTLEEQTRMSEAARKRFETQFSMQQHLRHIAAIYKIKLVAPVAEKAFLEMITEKHAVAI